MKIYPREDWEKNRPHDKGSGHCPLCHEEENVIWKGDFLTIVHNKFPILGLENHLMVIPQRHVIHTKDLNKDELSEMVKVEKFMEDFYDGDNYFSFIRQTLNGKSLAHIHYHYLPGILYYENIEEMLKTQGYPKTSLGKQ